MNKKQKYWIDFILKCLIAPIIVAIIISFIQINKLENTIQVQNSVIQENSIKIQELNTTIQQQNIQINNIQNNISSSQNKKEAKQEGSHNTQTNNF